VLLIEVEGLKEAVEEHADEIEAVCREKFALMSAGRNQRKSATCLWKGRKGAFAPSAD